MEVGGSRMQSQQKQVNAVNADIDKTTAAIAKANVGIKTAGRYASLQGEEGVWLVGGAG